MIGQEIVYKALADLNIKFEYYESPRDFSSEDDGAFWKRIGACRCKNLFMRNHKGNQHYLVCLDCDQDMNIHDIEKQLHQGKLSFASEPRLMKYLGVTPGSVTPFGLINDTEHHVHVFLDRQLQQAERVSFHPCINTASLMVKREDFERFLQYMGNPYEWIDLY